LSNVIIGGHFFELCALATDVAGGQAAAVRIICELGLGLVIGGVAVGIATLDLDRPGSITGTEAVGGTGCVGGTAWPQVAECLGQCSC